MELREFRLAVRQPVHMAAKIIGVSAGTLSRVERHLQVPGYDIIKRIDVWAAEQAKLHGFRPRLRGLDWSWIHELPRRRGQPVPRGPDDSAA